MERPAVKLEEKRIKRLSHLISQTANYNAKNEREAHSDVTHTSMLGIEISSSSASA